MRTKEYCWLCHGDHFTSFHCRIQISYSHISAKLFPIGSTPRQFELHDFDSWLAPVELVLKLDGVGPVDNRPSTDKLHHFIRKK